MKIPTRWLHLHTGDRIHTRIPFHRIEAYAEHLAGKGYAFAAEPSELGYWVICTQSPLSVPQNATRH